MAGSAAAILWSHGEQCENSPHTNPCGGVHEALSHPQQPPALDFELCEKNKLRLKL